MAREKIESVEFFKKSAKNLAKDLLGKILCYHTPGNEYFRFRITETEAYPTEDGTPCDDYKDGSLRSVGHLVTSGGGGLLITCRAEEVPDYVLIRSAITSFDGRPYNLLKSFTMGYSGEENRVADKVIDLLDKRSPMWLEQDEYQAPGDPIAAQRKTRSKLNVSQEYLNFTLNDPVLKSPLFTNLEN